MGTIFAPPLLVTALWLLVAEQHWRTVVQADPRDSAGIEARLKNEINLTPDQTLGLLKQLRESKTMDVSKLLGQDQINQKKCALEKLQERHSYWAEMRYGLADMEAVVKFLDDRYNKQLDFCLEMWKKKPNKELLKSLSKRDQLELEQFHGWVKFYEHQKSVEMGPLDRDDIVFIGKGKLSETLGEKDDGWFSTKTSTRRNTRKNLKNSCEAALEDLQQLVEFLRVFDGGKRSLGLDGGEIGAKLIMFRETYDYCTELIGRQ